MSLFKETGYDAYHFNPNSGIVISPRDFAEDEIKARILKSDDCIKQKLPCVSKCVICRRNKFNCYEIWCERNEQKQNQDFSICGECYTIVMRGVRCEYDDLGSIKLIGIIRKNNDDIFVILDENIKFMRSVNLLQKNNFAGVLRFSNVVPTYKEIVDNFIAKYLLIREIILKDLVNLIASKILS
jgi:hypothetical protein